MIANSVAVGGSSERVEYVHLLRFSTRKLAHTREACEQLTAVFVSKVLRIGLENRPSPPSRVKKVSDTVLDCAVSFDFS